MKLDRDLQHDILAFLRDLYPEPCHEVGGMELSAHPDFQGNLAYLAEHGLIEVKTRDVIGLGYAAWYAKITCYGLDFLEQDGGLNAILRMIPVRIVDAQHFLEAFRRQVEESDLPPDEKRSLVDRITAFATPVVQSMLTQALLKLPEILK